MKVAQLVFAATVFHLFPRGSEGANPGGGGPGGHPGINYHDSNTTANRLPPYPPGFFPSAVPALSSLSVPSRRRKEAAARAARVAAFRKMLHTKNVSITGEWACRSSAWPSSTAGGDEDAAQLEAHSGAVATRTAVPLQPYEGEAPCPLGLGAAPSSERLTPDTVVVAVDDLGMDNITFGWQRDDVGRPDKAQAPRQIFDYMRRSVSDAERQLRVRDFITQEKAATDFGIRWCTETDADVLGGGEGRDEVDTDSVFGHYTPAVKARIRAPGDAKLQTYSARAPPTSAGSHDGRKQFGEGAAVEGELEAPPSLLLHVIHVVGPEPWVEVGNGTILLRAPEECWGYQFGDVYYRIEGANVWRKTRIVEPANPRAGSPSARLEARFVAFANARMGQAGVPVSHEEAAGGAGAMLRKHLTQTYLSVLREAMQLAPRYAPAGHHHGEQHAVEGPTTPSPRNKLLKLRIVPWNSLLSGSEKFRGETSWRNLRGVRVDPGTHPKDRLKNKAVELLGGGRNQIAKTSWGMVTDAFQLLEPWEQDELLHTYGEIQLAMVREPSERAGPPDVLCGLPE